MAQDEAREAWVRVDSFDWERGDEVVGEEVGEEAGGNRLGGGAACHAAWPQWPAARQERGAACGRGRPNDF